MQPLNETALRDAIAGFVEPLMGVTLGEAGAVRGLVVGDGTLAVEIVLGFPVGGYEAPFKEALAAHLRCSST
jgi:hypothetical protein